jgi:hypothetical protein
MSLHLHAPMTRQTAGKILSHFVFVDDLALISYDDAVDISRMRSLMRMEIR